MNWEPSNASVLPPSTLTYPAAAIGLSVLPSGLALPNNELAAGKSYGLVIVTSSESCGLLICAGQKTDVQLLQTSDQNGLPIFWSGVINGSAAGWYASLGSYVDNVHQLGWYGDDSGGHGTHGYSFINRWGSAPFDVGAAAAFHGNPILIKPLQAPTLLTMASSSASRVFSLTPPGSGNYTLTINGETTGAIAAADTPSQVQTMLQNLPGLSGIAVDTSGIMGSDWPVLITVPAGLGAITASGATLAETTLQSGTTYYYVATAVANDETETVIGSQVSCTPTAAEPSVELVVTQDWGMSHARIYRSTSDGGPYSLIWILNPENPMSYGDHQVGIGVLDNGLIPQVDVPPTAPTPTSSVWQAWSGEPPSNVKLEGQDFAGTSQWSISAGGHFTGSNVGSALKTTPLYKQSHSVAPSATVDTQGSSATFSPDSGFSCIFPFGNTAIMSTSSGVSSESLTVNVKANYSDSTSQTETIVLSTNTTAEMGPTDFAQLIKDGVTITSFDVSVASSLRGSTASVSITIIGTNGL